ncbi:MAG: hypothetical protein U9P90_00615 [Patescibacteria group bacterium]|nr:hypothetical protein [Patescibacteria group bacterium]
MGILVKPAVLNLDLKRGDEYHDSIEITNITDKPLPLSVNLISFVDNKNFDTSALDWIKFKKSYFILNSNETRNIEFTIIVPQNSELKSYLFFLLLEPRLAVQSQNLRAIAKISVPLLIAVRETDEVETANHLLIRELSLSEETRVMILENFINRLLNIKISTASEGIFITQTKPYNFKLSLKNIGSYHYYPMGDIKLYNNKNELIAKSDIQERALMPGEEEEYNIILTTEEKKYSLQNYLGNYFVRINLNNDLNREVEFWFFSWKKFIGSLLVFLFLSPILLLLIPRLRKRCVLAGEVFFYKDKILLKQKLSKNRHATRKVFSNLIKYFFKNFILKSACFKRQKSNLLFGACGESKVDFSKKRKKKSSKRKGVKKNDKSKKN